MTYIVDPKVVEGAEKLDTTTGELMMAFDKMSEARFAKMIGADGRSLQVNSNELEQLLKELIGWTKVCAFHLQQGSDLTIGPEDIQGIN